MNRKPELNPLAIAMVKAGETNASFNRFHQTNASFAEVSKKVMDIDWPADTAGVYFLKLELNDAAGELISTNFYWLSAKGDENADFTDLNNLPEVNLDVNASPVEKDGYTYSLEVIIENPSSSLAFSVNPKIVKSDSKDLVLPVFWEDNYFSLLPGEKRSAKVEFNAENLDGEKPVLQILGWNIQPLEIEID